MTTDRQAHLPTRIPSTRTLSHRAWAVAEAAALALVIWSVAAVAGVSLKVTSSGSPQTIGAASVIIVAVLAGLAGWGLLALLERRAARPARTWTVIASAVLLLSLFGPLVDGVGTATLTLLALHLGVGAVLITQLPHGRSLSRRGRTTAASSRPQP